MNQIFYDPNSKPMTRQEWEEIFPQCRATTAQPQVIIDIPVGQTRPEQLEGLFDPAPATAYRTQLDLERALRAVRSPKWLK